MSIIPGLPFQELPAPFNRNNDVWGINDVGEIVGTYEDLSDPDDPDSLTAFGGIWQLNPDGTISGPTSLGDIRPAGYQQLWRDGRILSWAGPRSPGLKTER